jgi:hypothetical protein
MKLGDYRSPQNVNCWTYGGLFPADVNGHSPEMHAKKRSGVDTASTNFGFCAWSSYSERLNSASHSE